MKTAKGGMRSSGYKSPHYDDILVLLENGGGVGGARHVHLLE